MNKKLTQLQAAAAEPATDPMSFSEIREAVCSAICARIGADAYCYIIDIYPDSVVYQLGCDDTLYQSTYSIDASEAVTLGDAVKVEREVTYVPLQAAAGQLLAAVDADGGFRWRIQICKYGMAEGQPIIWPREALVAALSLYEGARVFCLNDTQHVAAKDRPMGKSVREIVGWVENVTDTGTALEGDFVILQAAKWLRDMAVDSFAHGKTDLFGFSHDVQATAKTQMVAGKPYKVPIDIKTVDIDVVYRPTNEGKLLRMAAACGTGREEKHEMKREQLVAALKTNRPEQYLANQTAVDDGSMTDEAILALVAAAPASASSQTDAGAETLRQMQLLASQGIIREALAVSGLPEPACAKIRKQFDGQIVTTETLQAAIKDNKELVDQLTASGAVHGAGDRRINVGRESIDRLQAAFDGMMGVPLADNMRDVPIFTSLRAAYVTMTGDTDITGVLNPEQLRRMQAAYGDATFAYVLGNTLYRNLVNDYRELGDYGVSRVVGANIRNARDFRTLESIRIGYYGDIPTVDTDTQDYPDLGEVSDERVDYALQERGGIITINRRMVINDDVRAIQRIITRLPRAARRTLAKKVFNPFITNSNYRGDGKAIFHVDHANLGTAAYAIASAEAARTAMFKQTEPNSLERLGLRPTTVCFPSDLRSLVTNVNNFNPQAVAVESGNSMFGFFQPAGLLENPFMTDTNDWLMFADPNEVEIVELAFLNGQQEPQMLVADNPANGQMFLSGKIQYRINHDYNCEVVDYRGVYKGIVP